MIGRGVGLYPGPAAIAPTSKWQLAPGGHQIRGVNISPQNMLTYPSRGYAEMYANWTNPAATNGWALWIKPQIDAAKALGANCVRFFGQAWSRSGSGSPYVGTPLSDTAYMAAWDQLLTYLRSQGMYAYPCLGGDSDIGDGGGYGYTPPLSWQLTESILVCRYLQKYADVIIGVDLFNEAMTWYNTAVPGGSTNGAMLYAAVKANAPLLKYTCSMFVHAQPTAPPSSSIYPQGVSFDFIDLHLYYNAVATDVDQIMSFYNKPMIVGEFGLSNNAGATARQTHYNSILGVAQQVTSGRQIAGAHAWTMWDQDPDVTLQYGMADGSGVLRTDVPSIFQTFPN